MSVAAIRARDAETTPYAVREGEYAQCKAAMDDRRALLAEVDRLTAFHSVEQMNAAAAERARIRAAVEDFPHNTWTSAQARERVLAAIDGEPT